MKKYLRLCGVMCLSLILALCISACSGNTTGDADGQSGSDSDSGETHEYEVKDVDFGDSQVHEELAKLDFEPGETIDSVYYKRASDPATGEACYLVKRSSDGEEQYLPLAKTVCYVDEMLGDRGKYERVPLSYVQDGVPVETYQYQIYTSVFAMGDDGSRYAEAQDHEANLSGADTPDVPVSDPEPELDAVPAET